MRVSRKSIDYPRGPAACQVGGLAVAAAASYAAALLPLEDRLP